MLLIAVWGISCEITLIWMELDLTDDQSTLVQVMAWCQAIRQQAITWANVYPDLCCHMVSLGHNELRYHPQKMHIHTHMYVGVCKGHIVNTLPENDLPPNGARPSAGTVLTEKNILFSSKFCWFPVIPYHFVDRKNIIYKGQWGLKWYLVG